MNHTQKITSLSVIAGMFLIAALVTTVSRTETALAQNMSNQTVVNQSASQMNQTSHKPDRKRSQNLQHQMFKTLEKVWKK